MGIFSLTMTELKQESFLNDFLSLDRSLENLKQIRKKKKKKKFLFSQPTKTYKGAEFLPSAYLNIFSIRK